MIVYKQNRAVSRKFRPVFPYFSFHFDKFWNKNADTSDIFLYNTNVTFLPLGFFFFSRWSLSSAHRTEEGKDRISNLCIAKSSEGAATFIPLILSWRRPLSYRNQFIDLLCKSVDWFLYNNGLLHERVKRQFHKMVKHTQTICRKNCRQTVWECLTILWDWRLKG